MAGRVSNVVVSLSGLEALLGNLLAALDVCVNLGTILINKTQPHENRSCIAPDLVCRCLIVEYEYEVGVLR